MTVSHVRLDHDGGAPWTECAPPSFMDSNRIVVGVDLSFWGLAALSWAACQARLAGVDLAVCADVSDALPGSLMDRHVNEVRRAMRTRAVPVLPNIDAASTLVEESRHASMVVLGCRGTGYHGPGVSTTVPAVARSSACDVVIVGGDPGAVEGRHRWTSVLLAGSAGTEAVRGAVRLALLRGTALRILCYGRPAGMWPVEPVDEHEFLDAAVALARRLAPSVPVDAEVARGGPQEVVAGLTDTNALAVGVDGRLDSVARAALYHACCPVLLAKRLTPMGRAVS